ncbi:uncharacterized protein UDID_17904 [Ustilago sp. UG-2017a]|nr:uncharacterized protein UDID_17904 [Ustilago sp. UG-2017a]
MLLEDMEASNPSYIPRLALSTKYAWFDKMHKMINGQFYADPTALITTPSLDFTIDIPMDLSGSEPYDHSAHGHGLPPILDLMDSTNPPAAVASTSGASVAAPLSPGTKHKRGALNHKCNMLAEAFYHSSIDTLQIHLQLEQECTRHKRMLEAECTKHKEMCMQHEREEKDVMGRNAREAGGHQ